MAYIFQKKSTGVWYLIDKKLDKPWNFLGLINRAQAKDALKNYEQKKLHLRLGIPVAPTNITIQELVEEFIDNIRGINGALTVDVEERRLAAFCKVSSESSAGSVLFDRIGQKKKRVGEIKMHELTSAKIEKFIIAKRYKPNTARLLVVTLRQVYKYAIQKQYIDSNPLLAVRLPKLEQLPPRFVDPAIIQKVLSAMTGQSKDYFTILMLTGMRPGEALRLQVRDISDDVIIVRHTKTKRFRAVPVHPKLNKILARLCKGKAGEDFLFEGKEGGHQKYVRTSLVTALRKAKVKEKISPYSFRHTFATQVLKNTANLRSVQTLLGHSHSSMTERYAHALPGALKEAVESLG